MKRNLKNQVAAIYCRLSKEDQDKLNKGDESSSIQNQKLLLMEYAVSKGFSIYKVYVDDDFSGFSDRPQFKQMLIDAEKGIFNIVLCKHQSRFTRDMQLVEEYIHGYFVEWGIRFISLTDNVDTAVKGGKKSRQINGLINEWYCEDLSESVKSVIKAKREKGQFVGAFVSYGYKKDPENKHKLIVDEEAAAVVKEIFRLYLSGLGFQAISQELTIRAIPTPAQYKKLQGSKFSSPNQGAFSVNYGAWSINTIRRILRNEIYIGNMVQGREQSISYKTKKIAQVPKEQWAIVPDTHEPIIDKEDFYAVQQLIDHRRTVHYDVTKGYSAKPRLLAGKVRCLDCGGVLHRGGQSKDGKTIYYRCRLSQKTKGRDCTPHNINGTKLEKLIEKEIQKLIGKTMKNNYDEIYQGVCKTVEDNSKFTAILEKKLIDIENQMEQLQKSIRVMYSDRLKGIITEEEFITFKDYFTKIRRPLTEQKAKVEAELLEYKLKTNIQSDLEDLFEKYKEHNKLTHEIINDFIDCIQIGEINKETREQEIVINWTF